MPEESWHGTRNSNNSGVTINNLGKTSYILLAVFAGFAVGCGIFALLAAQHAERETRMLEYYVLEMDAKLIAAGVKKPEEAVAKQLNQEKRK
ncbi:MAG TPA: hypothetical protein VFS24_01010 [Steroidobacteraceae bacterium]|nr:hypothetical protein [Steroidobacteraceae bacterium]